MKKHTSKSVHAGRRTSVRQINGHRFVFRLKPGSATNWALTVWSHRYQSNSKAHFTRRADAIPLCHLFTE